MPNFEYKVVPAPQKGTKAKGVKTPEGRFALSVEELLNALAAEGWEYQRAELLPSEEKTGLTSSTTNWRNVLVFRRAIDSGHDTAPDAEDRPIQDVALPEARPLTPADAERAPAAIAQEANDPPLRQPDADTPNPETRRMPPFLSSRADDDTITKPGADPANSTAEHKD